ncbi:hypothetical protein BC939DRAFT_105364 [Gamsiella multidivaricata]|uniref:uncharacterized protein n=1 Tax=Gamsiella multidivaricata TaxID=101098 RepID=UPI0022210B19|nr:uncharacterized protein BC939DRAFT_105364 [Gamsiella multidivaricata]KAI7832493.1 hypothetical protein BC939DRAFT_105364 [Gamsiella multidivaricata]
MNSLRIRDVAHFSHDYDPFIPPAPCAFTEGIDPLPLHKDFTTPEAFRSFWKRERERSHWIFDSEKHSRVWYNYESPLGSLPVATIKVTGRPPQYDWSIKHLCRFSGVAKKQSEHGQRDSVRQNCPVFIRIQKLRGEERVRIEYHWLHSHDTDPVFHSAYPRGRNEQKWIESMVKDGRNWRSIREKLTLASSQITTANPEDPRPKSLLIRYDDVRSAMYRHRTLAYKKNYDVSLSVKLWMDTIRKEGGKSLFDEDVAKLDGKNYMIAWSSSFQIKIMQDNANIA